MFIYMSITLVNFVILDVKIILILLMYDVHFQCFVHHESENSLTFELCTGIF